ncbi:MAG: hypothetical protein JW973_03645 [Bacteroidales bacterium]|nr:hypothetical protein [Bacteroidales bacterium]
MKKIFNLLFVLLIISPAILLMQCDSEDDLVTENAKEGGLVDMLTPSMNYVVNSGKAYSFSMFVYQGEVKTRKLHIYRSFYKSPTDSTAAVYSNELEDASIDITSTVNNTVVSNGYYYADLINGLTLNGQPLPASDLDLSIGDRFWFRIVSELSDGRTVEQSVKVSLTVSTRYAGTYKFIEGIYYRIGVLTDQGSYWDPEYVIESVDAITYKMIGMCAWPDNVLYFQIDAAGKITYPLKWDGADQLLNDAPLITCVDNPTDMTNVYCSSSDYVINDDVGGKDRLVMSFGYYTSGSGPREFYQVLEKIVQ